MKRLEDELRHAMQREELPEGFAERVLARTAATKQSTWISLFASRGLRWALAGAMCLVMAVAGMEYRRAQEERARGEAAKAQLMLALHITANELQFVQAKLQQHGAPWID
jgi:coenzyme F420-reducing hydrogenase beta subunit